MKDELISKDVVSYVIGMDTDFFNISSLHMFFEFYNSIILDYEDDLADYTGEVDENIFNFFLRIQDTYLNDTLKISISSFYFYNDDGYIIKLSGDYLVSDELELTIGSNIFIKGNKDTGVASLYDNNDNIFLRLRYSF
jgi:hypothetical protein